MSLRFPPSYSNFLMYHTNDNLLTVRTNICWYNSTILIIPKTREGETIEENELADCFAELFSSKVELLVANSNINPNVYNGAEKVQTVTIIHCKSEFLSMEDKVFCLTMKIITLDDYNFLLFT